MSRNCTIGYLLLFSFVLAFAVAEAEEPPVPPPSEAEQPPDAPQPPRESPEKQPPKTDAPSSPDSVIPSEAGTTVPPPSSGAPLAYSASRSETALRIEDLMRGAAALRSTGNHSKAMELYNEVLTLAPRYAEAYRQRALTLVRLGDRTQAQIDYNRFLAMDPQSPQRVQEEIVLFEQSGRSQLGRSEAAAYSYGPTTDAGMFGVPTSRSSRQVYSDARYSWAQEAFQGGRYKSALQWATNSDRIAPRAETRALIAQIRLAQGDIQGAAADARAAAAMGPVIDWRTLYGFYGYVLPQFDQHVRLLQEFVRENPSSADGHFLLGYQHLILGQEERAHAELAIAAVLNPNEVVATSLLAQEGVEIVSSNRPLARAEPPREGVEREGAEVAGRPPAPPSPRSATAPAGPYRR